MDMRNEEQDILEQYVSSLRELDLKFDRLAAVQRLAADDLVSLHQKTQNIRRLLGTAARGSN
ncbi:MAG: hypothetical protein EG825_02230 [Rhodocyclaceae bacterium]|nr:hypothetical protein [Rhodocyclaceae bacterium]